MIDSIGVFGSGVMFILAIIGVAFLISPPHITTADHWRQGEAACGFGGVEHARRHVWHHDSLEVKCVNGASFTIKIKG